METAPRPAADAASARGAAGRLEPFAAGPVLGVAAGAVALLLAFASRYGYHRDELYFLAASRHLAWGYVDQPPMAVFVAWLDRVALGDTLFALRLIPALLVGVIVVLTGAMARELGGSRFAQGFAALGVASAGFLVVGHLEGPTVFDACTWALVSWLMLRILRTGDERLWLAVGATVGVGLEAKQTILLLLGGLAVGFFVNGQRSVLRSRWLWAGAAIAVVGWAPNLAWEAANGWPTLTMDRNLRAEHSGIAYVVKFPFITVLALGVFLAPVWMAGWWALWRRASLRAYRAFAIAFGLGLALLWVFIPDRFYYVLGGYPVLFAAGAIVTDDVVAGRRGFFRDAPSRRRLWRSRASAVVIAVANGLVFLPIGLPVLPASAVGAAHLNKVNYNLGEEIGWPQLVREVATVWRSLPPATRATTAIVTGNYGEAGAVIRFGAAYGLPAAYSGHNSFSDWGPPPASANTAIAIGFGRRELTPYFGSVSAVGRIRNAAGVDNDEQGTTIWLCTGQRRPWRAIWPQFRHYG